MIDPRLRDLAVALGLEADPAEVLREVKDVYAALDARLSESTEGLDLPCGEGCHACCHEAVFVCAPELLAVAELLFGWSDGARAAVIDRMLELALDFEDELELLETLEAGPERDEVAARVKFTCPLLSSEGRCRVYPVRELNARTFGQSIDERSGVPYGCEKTHARLAVLPSSARQRLPGARAARAALVEKLPDTARVHVYPWWFRRYEAWLRAGSRSP